MLLSIAKTYPQKGILKTVVICNYIENAFLLFRHILYIYICIINVLRGMANHVSTKHCTKLLIFFKRKMWISNISFLLRKLDNM